MHNSAKNGKAFILREDYNKRPKQAVDQMLAAHLSTITTEIFPDASRSGDELRCGDIYGAKGSSFALKIVGQKAGLWIDHASGERGDFYSLLMTRFGLTFSEALNWLASRLGISEDMPLKAITRISEQANAAVKQAEATQEAKALSMLNYASGVWDSSVRITAGDPVDVYLKSRAINIPLDHPCFDNIRIHTNLAVGGVKGPAMVARRTDFEDPDLFCGIHRTLLVTVNGTRIKKMAGGLGGANAVVRLADDADITTGLFVAEGIETALSLLSDGFEPVVAALSAGGIDRLPVVSVIESLTIVADRDDVGIESARRCAKRWIAAGREAEIFAPPKKGQDFNDLLKEVRDAQ